MNKIEYRNKSNMKGIRITDKNIKGWRRDKKTGSRKYTNAVDIDNDIFELIKSIINGENEMEELIIPNISNNTKFILDSNKGTITIRQYNVPLNSSLKYIPIKYKEIKKEYVEEF